VGLIYLSLALLGDMELISVVALRRLICVALPSCAMDSSWNGATDVSSVMYHRNVSSVGQPVVSHRIFDVARE